MPEYQWRQFFVFFFIRFLPVVLEQFWWETPSKLPRVLYCAMSRLPLVKISKNTLFWLEANLLAQVADWRGLRSLWLFIPCLQVCRVAKGIKQGTHLNFSGAQSLVAKAGSFSHCKVHNEGLGGCAQRVHRGQSTRSSQLFLSVERQLMMSFILLQMQCLTTCKWANSLQWLIPFMINCLHPIPKLIFNNLVICNKCIPISLEIVD